MIFLGLSLIIVYMLFLAKAIMEIINKINNDSSKNNSLSLAWLLIVLFVPLVGLILYYKTNKNNEKRE